MYDSPILQQCLDCCYVIWTSKIKECSEIDGHNLQQVIQLDR